MKHTKHIRRKSEKPKGKTPQQILASLGLTQAEAKTLATKAQVTNILKQADMNLGHRAY